MFAEGNHANAALDRGLDQGHAAGAKLLHLVDAQCRHGTDPQATGNHAADGRQLVAFESHRQFAVLGGHVLFHQQAHRRRALQGNEVFGQQLCPADPRQLRQGRIGGHHGDEAVHVQRVEIQAIDVVRFEADAQFDATMAHQFLHLFVDHIVHRDVDLRVTLAKYLQRVGQQVAGKGRHGRHRNPAQLQGETLAQHFFGVVPVGQQAPCQRQQHLALGSQADAACGAAQQGAAKVFFQGLDGQAQGRL